MVAVRGTHRWSAVQPVAGAAAAMVGVVVPECVLAVVAAAACWVTCGTPDRETSLPAVVVSEVGREPSDDQASCVVAVPSAAAAAVAWAVFEAGLAHCQTRAVAVLQAVSAAVVVVEHVSGFVVGVVAAVVVAACLVSMAAVRIRAAALQCSFRATFP